LSISSCISDESEKRGTSAEALMLLLRGNCGSVLESGSFFASKAIINDQRARS
jgi:hypothetical protein